MSFVRSGFVATGLEATRAISKFPGRCSAQLWGAAKIQPERLTPLIRWGSLPVHNG